MLLNNHNDTMSREPEEPWVFLGTVLQMTQSLLSNFLYFAISCTEACILIDIVHVV